MDSAQRHPAYDSLQARISASKRADGYSLLELLVVVALIGVGVASTIMVGPAMMARGKADSASTALVAALKNARGRAIGERRNFQLVFTPPNRFQVFRVEIPSGATTQVNDIRLENGQQFHQFSGVADTPDAFGATGAISFGSTPAVLFTSEGTLVDSSGDVLNGTIFLGRPGDYESARAVTLFGVTGLVRTWTWTGDRWLE